jgi:4-hydroxybenzoate polyprenyltransferase
LLLTALLLVGYWGPPPRSTLLLVGLFALAAYGNLWQKRSRRVSPVVMDHLFGLMMGVPILYGAIATGGDLGTSVWLSAITFSLSMTLMNCVAGNLKDLAADYSAGVRTTALELGVRPGANADSHPTFPRHFQNYVLALSIAWGVTLGSLAAVTSRSSLQTVVGVAIATAATACTVLVLRSLFGGHRFASPTGSEPYIYLQFVALNLVLVPAVGLEKMALLFACSAGWVYALAFVELYTWRSSRSEE